MYTSKPTKNILTKESISKEIEKGSKSASMFSIIPFVAITLFIVLSSLFLFVIVLPNVELAKGVACALFIFFELLLLFVDCMFGFIVFAPSRTKKRGNGEFDFEVIEDRVSYKKIVTRDEHYRETEFGQFNDRYLHFSKCGDFKVDSLAYELASEDDEYYIVVPDKESTLALRIYAKKMYEYRE